MRRARSGLTLSVGALVLGLSLTPAQARDKDEHGAREHGNFRRTEDRQEERWREHRFERREFERRGDVRWHFDRGRGWRFEQGPAFWSPHYVWWRVGPRVVLLAAPAVTVVQYPYGRYELRGDGIYVPYQWVWIPTRYVVVPAPAPPPYGAPLPPEFLAPPPPPFG